ncbi:MAG: hypothetical protein GY859_40545 [Desulfobacterales bacterium]|nr:hypothetical protein [Desulfobacterales bacterium]
MDFTIEFRKRVGLVLTKIMERDGLSKESLAESLECDAATLDDFINHRVLFETEDVVRLTNLYNVNVVWLYTGGESPFYPDGEGPMAQGDDMPAFSGDFRLTPEVKTEYLEKAATILDSKKPGAKLLAMMIDVHLRINRAEDKHTELKLSLAEEKEKLKMLEKEVEALERE